MFVRVFFRSNNVIRHMNASFASICLILQVAFQTIAETPKFILTCVKKKKFLFLLSHNGLNH